MNGLAIARRRAAAFNNDQTVTRYATKTGAGVILGVDQSCGYVALLIDGKTHNLSADMARAVAARMLVAADHAERIDLAMLSQYVSERQA